MQSVRAFGQFSQFLLQRLALATFVIAALALLGASVMAALGQWAWISLPLSYQGTPVENAGMYAQIALTVLALGMCFFVPSNRRIMQLENSHRRFSIGMQDVARAYAAAHAGDRKTAFTIGSEFDSVRDRLAYLRDHPDLGSLEPATLEVAAQMSHLSAELAAVYSDEKIDRARRFLEQRQQEIDVFTTRLERAKMVSSEMHDWLHEVEVDEAACAAQLERLRRQLDEILPELGTQSVVRREKAQATHPSAMDKAVIALPPMAAE